jgi:hypothetical protein
MKTALIIGAILICAMVAKKLWSYFKTTEKLLDEEMLP